MKAIVYHTYGSPDVLHLEEVQKPIPQDDYIAKLEEELKKQK